MNNERISSVEEFIILTKAYISILFSNVKNLGIMMGFPIVASAIIVWIAGKDMFVTFEGTKSGCFIIVCAAIWGGLFNSIQTIVQDRKNIKRDYASGLRWECYTLSRALVQFVLCLIQSLILLTSIFFVTKFYDNPLPEESLITGFIYVDFYIVILLIMYSSDCMGLVVSSLVKKSEAASVLSPYILIAQLILSGVLFKIEGTAEFLSKAMIARWGMEGMGSICFVNDLELSIQQKNPDIASLIEREADMMFEATSGHVWLAIGVLFGFCVLFILLSNIFLRNIAKDTR